MSVRQRQFWVPKGKDKQLLAAVLDLIRDEEYRPFWPLTLRQIYYGLVGRLVIENTKGVYHKIIGLITKARLSNRLPWESIMDNNRDRLQSGGFASADRFVQWQREDFLDGYSRDLAQSQPVVLEIWVEKDALARVVHDVAQEYCLDTVVAKGYSSVSYVNELRNRIHENSAGRRSTKILYFGDLDPSGWNMLPAMFMTLHDEMGVSRSEASYERCALTKEQVIKYKLPQNPNALKDDVWQAEQRRLGLTDKEKGDPRAEGYKKLFGKLAVELDAFTPRTLQSVVRAAIERNSDMGAYEAEREAQLHDAAQIDKLKMKVDKLLKGMKW